MVTPVMPTYARFSFIPERGEGANVYGTDGRRMLDFGAGIAVNSLGHAHPHLMEALKAQAEKLWHVSNLYEIPGQTRLAERLVEATFADTVFFCNSGAEAMEASFKLARRYHWKKDNPERFRILTFEGAFHGRTLATIAAGGQAKYLEGFGPKVEGFDQVPFGDHDAMKAAITDESAAILVEPVQGEGGIRPIPPQCLRGLRELCDEHGLLLIFDEIQCGIGRTGKLWGGDHAGVSPDIMGIAKAMGGGFPIGAVLATEKGASGMDAGVHGTTFGGNPLAMAVGNAVLDVVLADGFIDMVAELGLYLTQQFGALAEEHGDVVAEIRGLGLMQGIRLKEGTVNLDVVKACQERGLLTIPAGENVVRILPPLIVDEGDIREALKMISGALDDVKAMKAKAS